MQVYTSLQADNHASTPPLELFTGRMPFLLPNQQRQSTEGYHYHLLNWRCLRHNFDSRGMTVQCASLVITP